MGVRYDTWPETLECARCGETFTPPSREDCVDGFPPSGRCDGCEAKEDFFRLLQLHRVNHIHPRGRCLLAMRRVA